jgi:hypothetical protein
MTLDPFIPSGGQVHMGQSSGSQFPSGPSSSEQGGNSERLVFMVEALERKMDTILVELQHIRQEIKHQ